MKIAIFGSGVSGLFAYWACEQRGFEDKEITFYSNKIEKPFALGFQYLHEKCGLDLKNYLLREEILQKTFPLKISSLMYSLKVYGNINTYNSVSKLLTRTIATSNNIYNLNDAIEILWNKYKDKIIVSNQIKDIRNLIEVRNDFDIIFSTIPLNLLFPAEYFEYSTSYVMSCPIDNPTNCVYYDVSLGSSVFRLGVLFNNFFVESTEKLRYGDFVPIKKVVTFTGDMKLPENINLIGRYGAWDKAILAHNVYKIVRSKFNE